MAIQLSRLAPYSTLLCKVFLQHLGALLSLEEFTGLWLRVLDYLDKYMHAGHSELLLEAVRVTPCVCVCVCVYVCGSNRRCC